MDFDHIYRNVFTEHRSIIEKMFESEQVVRDLAGVSNLIVNAFVSGNKLLICGNGGSAADAQHIESEFVGRFYRERRGFNAEALSVSTSTLTSVGNDYSFEEIFSRQVEAKGVIGDVLIGITTSGTSKNIVAAFETAKTADIKNICLTGANAPASLDTICDFVIRVPSTCTPRIQECHILIGHIVCEYVEEKVVNPNS